MVAKGNHAGRIFKQHSDRLGRYCYAAMHGKDGGGIILINLYRVAQNKGVKAGINTLYMRQRDALRVSGDRNPDPKNQVLADLTDIIQEWTQRGFHPTARLERTIFFIYFHVLFLIWHGIETYG